MTKRIAILDNNGILTGAAEVADDAEGIDIGDLKTDGSYKWDDDKSTFLPVGMGFGKVVNGVPPYSLEYVVAELIDALPADSRSGPMVQWLKWFNDDLRKRERERVARFNKTS